MYKLIVLSAVFAVASAAPPLLGHGLGVGVISAPLAIPPATIVNSPAGAAAATINNQILSGVTGLNAGLLTTAGHGLVAPLGIVGAPALGLGLGNIALANAGLGNIALVNAGLIGGRIHG